MITPTTPTISADWLIAHIDEPNLIILDTSLYADHSKKFIEFQDCIPGAVLFDLRKNFIDSESQFPNTMPSPEQFQKQIQTLGVNSSSTVIVYDNRGVYSSPRAWFMLKAMGHQNVFVLDGGLPSWQQHNGSISKLKTESKVLGNFLVTENKSNFMSYAEICSKAQKHDYCLIDARSSDRFHGLAPEPRPELQSGHINGSLNLPYVSVLKNGYFKPKAELLALFLDLELENKKLVFTCGSGLTACIILLAAELVLDNPKAVYDGSWTEWATLQGLFTA